MTSIINDSDEYVLSDSDEDVLFAFAVEESHDNSTFERYIRQYPHLAGYLAELSLELRLQRATCEIDTPVDEALMMAKFRAGAALRRRPKESSNGQ